MSSCISWIRYTAVYSGPGVQDILLYPGYIAGGANPAAGHGTTPGPGCGAGEATPGPGPGTVDLNNR